MNALRMHSKTSDAERSTDRTDIVQLARGVWNRSKHHMKANKGKGK